jgi:hypothetical protein
MLTELQSGAYLPGALLTGFVKYLLKQRLRSIISHESVGLQVFTNLAIVIVEVHLRQESEKYVQLTTRSDLRYHG